MVQFQSALRASQGARRYQEDAALIWPVAPLAPGAKGPERLVTVLADGMGGHAGGAVASRIACELFLASITQSSDTGSDNREKLLAGLFAANGAIAARIAAVPALSGMGSTLVGALFGPLGLEWVSVGDSPLYLFRNNEIALLNEDHSLAPALDQMAAEGKVSFEQARNDPRRHLLRSAVTGEDIELIDVSRSPLRLEAGDYVVQASDGIHTLEPDEIARVISAYKDEGCESVAAALVRSVESMRDPHQDNITVIIVRPV